MEYNIKQIEQRARQNWENTDIYRVYNESKKPKYYVLDMFPYPSGAGLHVGHPLGYIASDIYARYKRHQGFNVLHPMGFDAFGLPAEQYAIETGQHPAQTTRANIKRYKSQLDNIGFSFDWSREINTTDACYFKWTQWIFSQLFESWYDKKVGKARAINELVVTFEHEGNKSIKAHSDYTEVFTAKEWTSFTEEKKQTILLTYRLAYLAYAEVNWCPYLGTVLANDEVKDGRSERGGHPVVKKKMRQWFLRITAYAERLLKGLEDIDWSVSLKEQQRNWIGKSTGTMIQFNIADCASSCCVNVFTTRPDTIFGVTFLVLAPEHPMVKQLTIPSQFKEVDAYVQYCMNKSDIERQQEKKVTGVFTGSYAIHPFTSKKIPIYVSEYVLVEYGTGVIMAVPARDERDFSFAQKFNLPIIEIIDQAGYPNAKREDKVGELIHSDFMNGLPVLEAIDVVNRRIKDENIGYIKTNYRLRDAGFSRQRYWGEPFPIIYKSDIPYLIEEKYLPLKAPHVEVYKPTGDGSSPLASNSAWVNEVKGYTRETNTMPAFAGSSWYFLRYMDPDNSTDFISQEAVKYWREVDLYIGGAEHAVGHLLYARFWHKFFYDKGYVPTEEPFKRLLNQGMIQGTSSFVYRSAKNPNLFVSHTLKDTYKDETYPMHVDIKLVKNHILDTEGFKKWRKDFEHATFVLDEDGLYRCGSEVEKMSKTKYNVVNPDDIIDQYGADCFRMYEMFLGPIESHKPWDMSSIEGVFKFLKKMWRLFYTEKGQLLINEHPASTESLRTIHKTIKKVNEDIGRFSFNTCISAFMVCVNELTKQQCTNKDVLSQLLVLMHPFAPFITHVLWSDIGQTNVINDVPFPKHNNEYLFDKTKSYPVSINGKVRVKIELPLDINEQEVQKRVLANQTVQKWVKDVSIQKFIFVPNRIINIVI